MSQTTPSSNPRTNRSSLSTRSTKMQSIKEFFRENIKEHGTEPVPKKANLLDHRSIKYVLDETVSQIISSHGYAEDATMCNLRFYIGTVLIIIALIPQFYPTKYTEGGSFLMCCVILVSTGLLQLIICTKDKDVIMVTNPPNGSSANAFGMQVSSKLPRLSTMYTLTIASLDPKPTLAKKPVELTKSVTKWFTEDGDLVESLVWDDVQGLLKVYAMEKKTV